MSGVGDFTKRGGKHYYWDFTENKWVETDHMIVYTYGCTRGFPYGSVTLEHYVNATQIISKSKNIYIRTDNPKWLEDELKNNPLTEQYNIFTSHVYENHRKGSIRNAASYFAGIEIARKCPAFVGHSGSAVTTFWLNHLCAYHNGKFGSCPAHFDFAVGPPSWKKVVSNP